MFVQVYRESSEDYVYFDKEYGRKVDVNGVLECEFTISYFITLYTFYYCFLAILIAQILGVLLMK